MVAKSASTKQKADTSSTPNDGAVDQAALDAQAAAAAQAKAEAEAREKAEAEAREKAEAQAREQAEAQARAAAEEQARAEAQAAADAAALLASKPFPRDMSLVNETAQQWVVRRHVMPNSSVSIHVRDADDLKRLRSDCYSLLSISDHYRPVVPAEGEEGAPHALRVVEIEDDQT